MLIGTTPTKEAPKDTPVNGFKTAFLAIASYFGRPTSETVLFSGLPIDLTHPTFEDVERSATRIGLEVVHHSFNRAELTAANLPMMLLTGKGNVVALLEEVEPNRFLVGAADSKNSQHVTTEQLISLKPVELYSFSAIYINATDRADLGAAQDVERRDWLWGTLSIFWKSYMNVALAALFINCIGLASPLFIMNVYDRILPNQALSSLWVLAIGVIVALIFDLLLKTARSAIIDHTGKVADQKLSYLLFEKVLYSQLSSRSASTGEYASRLGQYELVREFFTSSTVSVLIDSVFVFIFVGVIYLIAGWLAIIPATAFVLALIIGLISQYRIGQRVATAANEAAERNSLLVESVSTIETVKALRGEALLLRKWAELTKKSSKTSVDIKKISAGTTNSIQFVSQMVSVVVVLAGAYAFSEGVISTGAIIATVILSGRTIAPLGQIAMTLSRLRQVMMSLKILNEIMSQPEDIPQSAGFVNRKISSGKLELKSVEFSYPETENPVLTNISFSAKPGERIGVIGKIGAGKTTLGKLLCSLYQPTGGTVLIDGVEIRQYHPHEVRSAISFAGQSADLFSGTLKENLLVTKPEATDEEIIAAAQKTGVDDFASRHPRGYDMPVGERGDKLSGGQKQSVAIARLLLTNPKVVFLDEPTGAMDMASERQLLKTLDTAFDKNTTLLISTHRYSLLDIVDRLIVLDSGRLVADGPKDVVMQQLTARAKAAAGKT